MLKILDSSDLIFVTNDNGFFEEKNTHELNLNLTKEAQAKPHNIETFKDLEFVLSEFRENYEFPSSELVDLVDQQTNSLRATTGILGFQPASGSEVTYQAFATEKAGTIEVRFEAVTPYYDIFSLGRHTKGLEVEGRALYSTTTREFEDVSLNRILLTYMDIDGQQKSVPGSVVYLRPEPIVLGGPHVVSSNRRDLIGKG